MHRTPEPLNEHPNSYMPISAGGPSRRALVSGSRRVNGEGSSLPDRNGYRAYVWSTQGNGDGSARAPEATHARQCALSPRRDGVLLHFAAAPSRRRPFPTSEKGL